MSTPDALTPSRAGDGLWVNLHLCGVLIDITRVRVILTVSDWCEVSHDVLSMCLFSAGEKVMLVIMALTVKISRMQVTEVKVGEDEFQLNSSLTPDEIVMLEPALLVILA